MMRASFAGTFGEPVHFPSDQHQKAQDDKREAVGEPVQTVLPGKMADFPSEQQSGRQQVEDEAKLTEKFSAFAHWE